MLFVFYFTPKKDGLVLDINADEIFDLSRITGASLQMNEKKAKEFMRAMDGDRLLINNVLGESSTQMDEEWLR